MGWFAFTKCYLCKVYCVRFVPVLWIFFSDRCQRGMLVGLT